MKKERPILFSSAMVQALLAGRKTQTRRIVKPQPTTYGKCSQWKKHIATAPESWTDQKQLTVFLQDKCPYGHVGDILWVRESWRWDDGYLGSPKEASRIWLEVVDIRVERVQDISEEDAIAEGVEPNCSNPSECPSTKCSKDGCQSKGEYFHYMRDFDDFPAFSAKESFFSLWEKINGEEGLEANPWVWIVKFRVLSTTGKPETR